MKKGFTLVELLAVIVVLAIISLIATPTLTKVVSNAKKSASIESARGYIDSINTQIISSELSTSSKNINDGTYNINDLDINIKGKKPDNGIVTVDKKSVKEARLCLGKYSVDYDGHDTKLSSNNYCGDTKITILSNGKEVNNTSKGGNTYTVDLTGKTNINCSNGAVPEISGNTLTVKNALGNTTCDIGSSLKYTFTHLNDGDNNVLMVNDETLDYSLTLNENKKVNLNLGNNTINFTKPDYTFLIIKGNMTISGKENGTIRSVNKMIFVEKSGMLNILSGNFIEADLDRSAYIMITVFGHMTIDGGYIKGNNSNYTVASSGKDALITINGGEIYSKNSFGLVSGTNSNIIINNGIIHNDSNIDSKGIVGGLIASALTGGNITINDGEFYSTGASRIASVNGENSYLTINGGTFKSDCNLSALGSFLKGHLIINNAYVENKKGGAVGIATGADGIINGGTFISYGPSVVIPVRDNSRLSITDKKNKIYVGSYYDVDSQPWNNVGIVINKTSNLNIIGHKADKCDEKIGSNKKGICIYSRKRTVLNEVGGLGTINIDGATIVSDKKFALSTYNGVINVNNADIISNDIAIGLVEDANAVNQENAVVNVCNSNIQGKNNDIYIKKDLGYVKYNSSVNFNKKINDLNSPTHVSLDNTITCTN